MRIAGRMAMEEKRERAKLRRAIEPRRREVEIRRRNRDDDRESLKFMNINGERRKKKTYILTKSPRGKMSIPITRRVIPS